MMIVYTLMCLEYVTLIADCSLMDCDISWWCVPGTIEQWENDHG